MAKFLSDLGNAALEWMLGEDHIDGVGKSEVESKEGLDKQRIESCVASKNVKVFMRVEDPQETYRIMNEVASKEEKTSGQ